MSENNSQDQHNSGGLIAFLFSMVFVFAFFFYVSFIDKGIDLGENLKTPEVKSIVVEKEVDISKIAEPWVANPDMVTRGKKVFGQNCALCHGAEGHGDGAAGQALDPKPRNLVDGPWKKVGGFTGWFTVVTHGIEGTGMASFAHIDVKDRWAVVQFIDSITKAKVSEDPAKVEAFAKANQ